MIMDKLNPFKSNAELTNALHERGLKQLSRVGTIIDVLYALMLYKLFMFLPRPEIDGFTKADLFEVLSTSYLNYLVMFVGFVLILMYWNLSNLQFGNLARTDGRHATLSIIQTLALFVYLYFVRLDVEFDGAVITLQMESIFLAIAGFLSVWSWHYAVKNNLTTEALSKGEKDSVYLKLMPEPIVSVLTLPFAVFGADIWTLSWLLLIPVGYLLKLYRKRLAAKEQNIEVETE